MTKQFNTKKIYNFVFADRNAAAEGGSYSFNSYTDIKGALGPSGARIIYDEGQKDRHGRPVGKYFALNQSHYNLQAREDQADTKGLLLYDFLRNHPDCEGSPNGTYIGDGEDKIQLGVKFKLMNTAKDAQVALDAGIQKTKAQASALELDDNTLQEVAAHIGAFGEADELMRVKVYDWAGKRPKDYFEILHSGDRAVRAIIRKAIIDGIFRKQGEVIMWDNTVIGSNENSAVSTLLGDKRMLDALQENVDLKTEVKVKGKPGPKPKKVEA